MFLNQPWSSWMFGEVILVWGFVSWLVLRFQHHRPIQSKLDDAAAVLDLYPNQKLFIDHFQHVDGQLTNNRLLAKEWFDFKRSLIIVDGAKSVLGTKNPENFFNLDNILKDFEIHYYKFMPRYLVGTGLLISFTFLITGLFFVSKEIAASDVNQSQQVLGSFLNEISFKFFPALVGIFTGMLFSWGQRNQAFRQNQQLDFFLYLLTQRIDFNDLEGNAAMVGSHDNTSYVTNSMNQIVDHLDNSMDSLKKKTVSEVIAAVDTLTNEVRQERKKQPVFDKESGKEIAIDFDEKFTNVVQTTLIPVLDSVKDEISGLAKAQEDTLRNSLGEMTTTSSEPGEAKQILQSVQKDMDQLVIRQEQIIQKGLAEITQQIKELFPDGKNTTLALENKNISSKENTDKIIDLLQGEAFLEPIIAVIRKEGTQFSKQNKEVSKEVLNDATSKLHRQVEAETEKLRQTTERIDRSAANLEENAGKIANRSLSMVEEALREEGARLLENNKQALQKTLGELTNQFQSQFNATTDELIQASKRLDQSATVFTQKTDEINETTQENLLEAVLLEGSKTRELMQDQPLLEKVAHALKTQSEELARSQSQTLQQALGDIAVKGSDGEVTIEPLLAAVKSESEKQLQRQDSIIRNALSSAVLEINKNLSPNNLIATIKSETERLAQAQDTINVDLAKLNKKLDPDSILSAIQNQTDTLAATQETISVDLAKLNSNLEQNDNGFDQDTLMAAMQDQTDRLAKKQDNINQDIAKLGESLTSDNLMADMQAQTAQLIEKLSDISLEPVLTALQTQSQELAKSQSQVLQQVLSDISVKGVDGEVSVEPILAAVKAESERQLTQQDTIIRKALDGAVAELNRSLSPDSVIAAMHEQTDSLSKQQVALSQDIAGINKSLQSDGILEAIQAKTDKLMEQQDTITADIRKLGGSLNTDTILENMQSQNAELLDKMSGLSVEPVLEAIKGQSEDMAKNQSQALQQVLGDIAVRGSDGEVSVEPILAAVKAESERQLDKQETIIRKALDSAVAGLNTTLAPDNDSVLEAIKTQTDNMNQQQDNLSKEIAALNDSIKQDSIVEAIQSQSELIAEKQDAITLDIAKLGESIDSDTKIVEAIQSQSELMAEKQDAITLDIAKLGESIDNDTKIVEAIQNQSELMTEKQDAITLDIAKLGESIDNDTLLSEMQSQNAKLLDGISAISLDPVLEALKTHSEEMARSQSLALQQVLGDIAVRGEDGEMTVEPLLAAVKAGNERQLTQQDSIIRTALDKAVADLTKALTPNSDNVLSAIQSQTNSLSQDIAGIHKSLTTSISSEDMQAQTAKLLEKISDISIDPVLEALKIQSQEMAEQQSQALQQALGETSMGSSDGDVSIETILAAVKDEHEQQLEQHSDLIRAALDSSVAQLNESLKPDNEIVLSAIQHQTEQMAKKQDALTNDFIKLGESLSADTILADIQAQNTQLIDAISNISLEPILDAIKTQSEEIAKGQSQALQQVLGDIAVKSEDGEISIDPLLAAVKAESERQLEQQEAIINKAFNSAIIDLNKSIAPETDNVISAIQSQTQSLSKEIADIVDINSSTAPDTDNILATIQSQIESLSNEIATVVEFNRSITPNSDNVLSAMQSQTQSLRKEIAAIVDINSSITPDTDNKLAAIQSQIESLSNDITGIVGFNSSTAPDSDNILAAIQSQTQSLSNEIAGIKRSLATTMSPEDLQAQNELLLDQVSNLSIDPVLAVLKTQSEEIAEKQSQTLQQALGDVAVKGNDGEVSIEPLLAAVQESQEQQLKQHDSLIRSALDRAVSGLSKSITPDTDAVLSAIQSQTDNLSQEITKLKNSISTQEIVEAIQSQGDQLVEKQDAITVDIAKLGESISNNDLLLEIQNHSSELLDRVANISLEPVLKEIKLLSEDMAKSQSRALQQALGDIAVRGGDGEVTIEPLLAAVRSESERQLEQQESIIRKALDSAVAGLNESLSPDTQSVIEAIQTQSDNLAKKQDIITVDLAKIGESVSNNNLLEDIQNNNAELLDKVSAISLEPVLEALKTQSDNMAKSQSLALQQALGDIAVRGGDGEVSIEPLIAAVKAESERQLDKQDSIIRSALSSAVSELNQSLAQDKIIEAIDGLAERQEFLNNNIEGLEDSLSNENVIDALQAETAQLLIKQDQTIREAISGISLDKAIDEIKDHNKKLVDKQNIDMHIALSELVSNLNDSFSLDEMVDVLQNGTEKLMQSQKELLKSELSGLSLEPILSALSNQSEQLAQNQTRVLHETLNDLAVSGSDGGTSIEPLLATMKMENTQQLERQETVIRSVLSEVVNDITEIKTETQNLSQRMDSGTGPNAHILETIIDTVKVEAERVILNQHEAIREMLDQANIGDSDGQNHTQVIDALKDELAKLSSMQENVVREAFTNASMESASLNSMEPLIDAVQTQTSILADTLQQTIQESFARQQEGEQDGISLSPVLDAIKTQGEELAVNQSRVMHEVLAEIAIPHTGNEPVLDTLIESIVEVVKSESERVLGQQSEIVREAMGSIVSSVDELFSTDSVVQTIKEETSRVLELLEEGQSSENLSLETILSAMHDQGSQILDHQSQTLNEVLGNVGIQGATGVSDLEAVVNSVKLEGEKLLQTQSSAVKEAIISAMADLSSGALAPDSIVDTLKIEMARLVELVESFHDKAEVNVEPIVSAIQQESETLNASLSNVMQNVLADSMQNNMGNEVALEPILEEIRDSGNRILQRVEADSLSQQITDILQHENEQLIERLTKQVTLGPILEMLQSQGEIVAAQHNQTIRETMSDLMVGGGMSQAMEKVIESIQIEGTNIIEQITEQVTIAPIAKSLEEYMEKISSDQFNTLQNTMTEVASRYANGQMDFKPLISVIQEEGEKVSTRISDQLASSSIIDILRSEVSELVKSQSKQLEESLAKITEKASEDFNLEPIITTLQTSSQQLTQDLSDKLNLEPVLNAVKQESEQLVKSQSELMEKAITKSVYESEQNIDLQPILAIMRDESQHLLQELHETSNIAPVLTAVKEESAKLLENQSILMEEAINRALTNSNIGLDVNSVISAIETSSQNLAQELNETTNLDPIIATVKEESLKLREDQSRLLQEQSRLIQDSVNEAVEKSSNSIDIQPIISAIESTSRQLAQDLSEKTNMEPLLAAFKAESARLVESQSTLAQKAIALAVKESGKDVDMNNIVSTMQAESKLLAQELKEKTSLETVLASVKEESAKLIQNQSALVDKAISQAVKESGQNVDMQPVLSAMQNETHQLVQKLSEKLNLDPVLETIKDESAKLIQNQSTAIDKAIAQAVRDSGQNINLQPILTAMQNESHRLVHELSEKIAQESPAEQDIDLQPLLAAIQAESQFLTAELRAQSMADNRENNERRLEIVNTINTQGDRIATQLASQSTTETAKAVASLIAPRISSQTETLRSAISGAVSNLRKDLTPEGLLETIRTESNRIASSLEAAINAKAAPTKIEIAEPISADIVKSAIKSETSRLENLLDKNLQTTAAKLEEQKHIQARSLDSVRNAVKSETARLENLLDKNLHTTAAKLEEQKNIQARSADSVTSAVKSETSRLESLLDKNLQTTAAKLEEQKNIQARSADSVTSAVKSETSRLESLLDKKLQTTAAKLEEQKNIQAATAKLVEQQSKPAPVATPSQKRPKWALSAPGETYSDIVGTTGKKIPQTPAPIKLAKEIHWDIAQTPVKTFTAQSIEGKSLIELMKSMKQYLIDQFGEQSDYLTLSIQGLVDRIEDNHPISEPEVIALLREIGDRSNLIMTSYNPDVPRVANLDKGFLKTAKELQKQVDELATSKPTQQNTSSGTLSNTLDPNNFRQKIVNQLSPIKPPKDIDSTRHERLVKTTQIEEPKQKPTEIAEPTPVAKTKPAFVPAKPISVVSTVAKIAPKKTAPAVSAKPVEVTATKPAQVAKTKPAFVSAEPIPVAPILASSAPITPSQTTKPKPAFVPGKPAQVVPAGVAPVKTKPDTATAKTISVVPAISPDRPLTKQELIWKKPPPQPVAAEKSPVKNEEPHLGGKKAGSMKKSNEPNILTPRSVTSKMKSSFFSSFLNKKKD
ncbi:MAG: hypothetical protein HQL71_05950 [Magnetococcales bacterium]|nr:hypothetical protein [Magnetococcales bacterium]